MADVLKTTATEFKQRVGKYLDEARSRRVVILKQGRPAAVLLSIEEFERLDPSASQTLELLTSEFDALVARMQEPAFQESMDEAFEATPQALSRAYRPAPAAPESTPRRRRRAG